MKKYLVMAFALFLSACATKLVPDDFAGPTAIVADSNANFKKSTILKPGQVEFFVVQAVDGKTIDNAQAKTQRVFEGRGFQLEPLPHQRRVPVKTLKVKLAGLTHHAAPISSIFGKNHRVTGTVNFQPAAGANYVVKGQLGPGYSAVWIETSDGRVVTEKIENRG